MPRVDGIVVLTGRLTDEALIACAQKMPVVVTGRTLEAPGLFSLNFDPFEGARLATRHLIELGHQRIAFIAGDLDHPDANERLRGYRAALEAAGIPFDPDGVVPGDYHEVNGLLALDRLLARQQRFTAIFSANGQMAFGAALGLQRRSLRVPENVSLVGVDGLPISVCAIPPHSTVHQPAFELGRLVVSAMLQLLAGKTLAVGMPAPRLIARESSRRLRG